MNLKLKASALEHLSFVSSQKYNHQKNIEDGGGVISSRYIY